MDAVGWQHHCLWCEARFDSGQARSAVSRKGPQKPTCGGSPLKREFTQKGMGVGAPKGKKLRLAVTVISTSPYVDSRTAKLGRTPNGV